MSHSVEVPYKVLCCSGFTIEVSGSAKSTETGQTSNLVLFPVLFSSVGAT